MNKAFPKREPTPSKAKPVPRPELGLREKLFLPELWAGLKVTNRHFWRNIFRREDTVTIEYPEQKRPYPEVFRGRHRLMKRPDGRVRCVACMCCSTACPANCIHIVAGETEDKTVEKFPVSFDIDWLKCVYCGLCVEACPCDAIRMDTMAHPPVTTSRPQGVVHIEELLENHGLNLEPTSIAEQGGIYRSALGPERTGH